VFGNIFQFTSLHYNYSTNIIQRLYIITNFHLVDVVDAGVIVQQNFHYCCMSSCSSQHQSCAMFIIPATKISQKTTVTQPRSSTVRKVRLKLFMKHYSQFEGSLNQGKIRSDHWITNHIYKWNRFDECSKQEL
jgi:hypothetical protein